MNNPDKFQVVETEEEQAGTRNVADRKAKLTRRSRRAFNGTTRHFELDSDVVKELSKEGHLAWINDDLHGGLIKYEDFGYRFVLNREVYGEDREDKNPNDRVHIRFGTADIKGTPQDIYLMLQPWVFYYEDQAVRQKAVDAVDQQIYASVDVANSYGKRLDYKTK